MSKTQIFLQGDGISQIQVIEVPENGTVNDIVNLAKTLGFQVSADQEPLVMLEDSDETLELNTNLISAGIANRSRIHVHRCRRIEILVNFQNRNARRPFPPSATVGRVKNWAAREFGLEGVDAAEHVLQICNSIERPAEDIHIGSLVRFPNCSLCFDLVPKERIEGSPVSPL